MSKLADKRTVDMQVIGDWVEPRSRVLDLGCGRGILLDYLAQTKQIQAFGVDMDFLKVSACVKRGIVAYQGDLMDYMRSFPDQFFDKVICSRTLEELHNPEQVIEEALRVGKSLAIGFVNHGYWKNRVSTLFRGVKPINEVYTTPWHESRPTNPLSINDFLLFCSRKGIRFERHTFLRGDWKTPCRVSPNFLAGYALFELRSIRGAEGI